MLYAIGRNINKYRRFVHEKTEKHNWKDCKKVPPGGGT